MHGTEHTLQQTKFMKTYLKSLLTDWHSSFQTHFGLRTDLLLNFIHYS